MATIDKDMFKIGVEVHKCSECEHKKQEWISVNDGLPNKLYSVLAIDANTGLATIAYLYNGTWYKEKGYFPWEPTHWMPLPKPPKGE